MSELFIDSLLQRAKNVSGKPSYICPVCGNGSGRDGTGITEITGKQGKWHCFKCNFTGDIYDIADIVYHREPGESFKEANKAGMTNKTYYTQKTEKAETEAYRAAVQDMRSEEKKQQAEETIKAYMAACAANMNGSEGQTYLKGRGFDVDFIEACGMGWDKDRKAVMIPYPGESYYTLRSIKPDANPKYYKPKADEAGPEPIFNGEALTGKTVFIMEGQLDALSIMQAGGLAVAIGGGGQRKIEDYKGPLPENVIIVADNDDAGDETAKRIREAFKKHNKAADIVHPPKGYKDANELLAKNENTLKTLVKGFTWVEYEGMAKAAGRVDAFLSEVKTDRYKPIETGFTPFDRITGGGLVPQSLVMLAAAPGQGKTTLTAQIFETIAKKGQQVIFVNLEMSREQLIAKSLARHAYREFKTDITANDVMRGYKWTEEQEKAVKQAALDYKKNIAPYFVYADRDEVTADLNSIMDYLKAAAEKAIRIGKRAPLVVIDYLHIIQTQDDRQREEEQAQAIKRSVIALKAFAIKYKTVVFSILATNREANKGKELTLYSGRDTSNIEYSADMFLTLQQDSEATEDNKPLILRMEKNRMGEVGAAASLYFDGKHGIFTEAWLPKPGEVEPLEVF